MEQWLEIKGARLVVHLPAELDHHCAQSVRSQVDAAIRTQPVTEVELNFAATRFMDSAGIGVILGRYQMMRALDGRLIVSRMNGRIRRMLELSGIRELIPLDEEEDA